MFQVLRIAFRRSFPTCLVGYVASGGRFVVGCEFSVVIGQELVVE